MVIILKIISLKKVMIFEFYEQKHVYLKLNLAQSTKQDSPQTSNHKLNFTKISTEQ